MLIGNALHFLLISPHPSEIVQLRITVESRGMDLVTSQGPFQSKHS